jgi:hypothetical protein
VIREHAANTAWLGRPAGILTDAAFFDLPAADQQRQLAPFAWTEFRCPLPSAPPALKLQRAGFQWIDCQLGFRIALKRVTSTPSLEKLDVEFADKQSFAVPPAEMKVFRHERFLELPGVTPDKLAERYAAWAARLAANHPTWCLRIVYESRVQGWYLSEPEGESVHLALAMLHKDASVTGLHLYQKALLAYASRGAAMGRAAFSVRNTDVHNIYSRLGALFTPPEGCWLHVDPAHE